jgi:transcriptional regulator with XRE-family HTH domain
MENGLSSRPGSFGDNLEAVLLEKRLSHQAAARLVGVSRQTISFWVAKKHAPAQDDVPAIAERLGVPPHRLLIGGAAPKQPRFPLAAFLVGGVHREISLTIDDELQAYLIELGSRLSMFRDGADLTVEECCDLLRVSPAIWAMWEQGAAWPDPLVLNAFCEAYGCSLDWLCRGDLGSLQDKTRTAVRKLDQRLPEILASRRRRKHMDRASLFGPLAATG